MLIALWIINVLLAIAFIGAGALKILRDKDSYVKSGMGWAENVSPAGIKAIGAIEIIGAIGLIVPLATGIAPLLTPLAAVGLTIVMIGAVVVHAKRKEQAVPAIVLMALSAVSAVLGFLTL